MNSTKMGNDRCPHCNEICDTATDPQGEGVPVPGDLSICIHCENINQYGDDMALEKFSKKDFDNLPEEFKDTIYFYIEKLKEGKEKLKNNENS